ncbi:hypothetical protein BGX34_005241 [Mortierella sp. NVP85]|nr:hypothetical protein BGX34_005241 [Mortierella sp. NVP85]
MPVIASPEDPTRRKSDYFDGDGERDSIVNDDNRHFICRAKGQRDFDVTTWLMRARNRAESDRYLPPVTDRLVLNFIFDLEFLESINVQDWIKTRIFPKPEFEDKIVDNDFDYMKEVAKLAKLSHRNFGLGFNKLQRKMPKKMPTKLLSDFVTLMTTTSTLWTWPPPGDGKGKAGYFEATYQSNYVQPITDMSQFRGFTIVVGEVKTPTKGIHEEDRGKLISMMKLSLNMLWQHGLVDPVVVGFYVQQNAMHFLSMELKFEALYFPQHLGYVNMTLNKGQLLSLADPIPLLLHKIANSTIERFKRRLEIDKIDMSWTRKSYNYKVRNKPRPAGVHTRIITRNMGAERPDYEDTDEDSDEDDIDKEDTDDKVTSVRGANEGETSEEEIGLEDTDEEEEGQE